MNLSSTMYRLNVPQNQQQQQQQQQQPTGGQSQQTTQQQQQQQQPSTVQQQQVIPSHIILQQQLAAAAAAATVNSGSGSVCTNTGSVLALHVANTNGGGTVLATTPTTAAVALAPATVAATAAAAAAAAAATKLAIKTTDDKFKLLTTANIKSEPVHEVIALTTSNSSHCSSSSSSTTITNTTNKIVNNNNSNSSNSNNNNSNLQHAVSMPSNATTNTSAAVAAALNKHQTNAVTSINLIVSGGGASSPPGAPATIAATSTITAGSSGSGSGSASANGHLVFVPTKRARLDAPEDWMSTPSPGSVPSSAPPLSPSPGSQNHSYSANMSNGYASPMSAGSYDPYSPNGKTGRDDLSPSSSLNGYSANEGCDAKKSKKGPAPRLQEELCLVCGDRASGYHYNALTCEGCKGFFRRSVTKNAVYCCKFGRACEMDMYMRRKCQECRLKKCLAVGMRPECVVPENQCAMKRREKQAQKKKDKQATSPTSHPGTPDYIKKEILELMTCEPPQHPTCPLLPEDILAKCQARNIPPLTFNQLAVIYKLIWYQDGYEQPSEEDLKRIMSQPDENESQTDVSFRHITEITILTVQLIVEFAKGLPAFTKIPQEDQITLLKACSSEVMMLRMARRYDHNSDSIFFANNRSYTRDSYKMAGMADNIEDLLHFCRQMFSMKVDNVEYALLTAIVIFSDRPGLEEAQLVEAIQSYYIDTLRIYILNRHCGDPMSLVFYAKLLSILTELRTLGNQNAEMCFSLKLKNRKLPKFLEEIWDVNTVPPAVQSHLQAQEKERMRCDALAASTSAAAQAQAAQQNTNTNNNSNNNNNNSSNTSNNSNNSNSNNSISNSNSTSGAGIVGSSNNVNMNNVSSVSGSGSGSSSSSGISVTLGIGSVISSSVATTSSATLPSHQTIINSSDYMGGVGVGGCVGMHIPPTATPATSSTPIAAAAVPASSTTANDSNVNMYNAQTALALMGVPLHHDQLIGGAVVKSEHTTTTA